MPAATVVFANSDTLAVRQSVEELRYLAHNAALAGVITVTASDGRVRIRLEDLARVPFVVGEPPERAESRRSF
jgi:hypothetical protein